MSAPRPGGRGCNLRQEVAVKCQMKNNFLVAVLVLAPLLLACSKADTPPALPTDQGCSEISIISVTEHSLSSSEVATANSLFARNNLDARNYRYVRYLRESVQTYYPPYASFDSQLVGVEEYTSGLPIFTGQSNFHFKNGVFDFRSGHPSSGTHLNTVPTLNAGQLRSRFRATVTQFDPSLPMTWLQCVSAEFGYYDLNAGTGNATENLVKAWKVTLKNLAYPFAYYEDNDGKLIYYDNGIRTFR